MMIEDKDNKLYEAYTKNVLHNKNKSWQLYQKLRTKKSFLEQLNKGNPLYTQYLNQNKDDE
jgi:hypothetical protein